MRISEHERSALPYGETEFWLSLNEAARVKAKGPFMITDVTIVQWHEDDAEGRLSITSERGGDTHHELSVRLGQIMANRVLRWPTVLWWKDPDLFFQLEGPVGGRVLIRISHAEVWP